MSAGPIDTIIPTAPHLQLTPVLDKIMATAGGSELPIHYGEKTADGEMVRRPREIIVRTDEIISPDPIARSGSRSRGLDREAQNFRSPYIEHSPDGDAIDGVEYMAGEHVEIRTARPIADLRRRSSNLVHHAGPSGRARGVSSDEERAHYIKPDFHRRLRSRGPEPYDDDDDEERDFERWRRSESRERRERENFERHPDHPAMADARRPPRTHNNSNFQGKGMDVTVSRRATVSNKPHYIETRGDYRPRTSEQYLREPDTPKMYRRERIADEESVDGYDYERHRKKLTTEDLRRLSKEERKEVLRLPWLTWMDSDAKNHFVATLGEFIGTTMFLFFAFAGTQVANIQSAASTATPATTGTTTGGSTGFNVSVYLYISLSFGFSLMVNVFIFFRISGGMFNPAVTLAMTLVGAVPPIRSIFLVIAQIAGSIAASGMVLGLFPTEFNVRTTLGGGTSKVQGVFIEAFLTAELIFTIFMLAKEKHKATFMAPVGIGLALFISELVGVYYTGGSLNPARSFGPCVVTATFDQEHWIYWVGPGVGTFIAVFFYKFIKMLEYEMANPGQDGDDGNDPTKNKEKAAEVRAESRQQTRVFA